MPIMKAYGGHGSSVAPLIGYLTANYRALDKNYINCWEPDRQGRTVAQQMDLCRIALETNDKLITRGKPCRWVQVVVSPDPKDDIDLRTLRDLVLPWAREHFGDYQVAIYYHDDNRNRVAHAHVVVNGANLELPGIRFGHDLQRTQFAEIYSDLQERATALGLHALPPLGTKGIHERRHQTQRTFRTAADHELERLGISWKQDVRDRITCAERVSQTMEEFDETLRALGLTISESTGSLTQGECIYAHPAREHGILGSSLGNWWTRPAIEHRLESDRFHGVAKPTGATRERLLEAVSTLDPAPADAPLQALGRVGDTVVTAPMVSDMVSALYDRDVRSTDDLDQAMGETTSPEDRKRLEGAAELAQSLGFLPERRPYVFGVREPRVEPVPGLEPWARRSYPSYDSPETGGMYFDAPSYEIVREGPELDFGR